MSPAGSRTRHFRPQVRLGSDSPGWMSCLFIAALMILWILSAGERELVAALGFACAGLWMVVYTGATVAFFLLGSALLHGPDMATDKVKVFNVSTLPKVEESVTALNSAKATDSFEKAKEALESSVVFTEGPSDRAKTEQIKDQLAIATTNKIGRAHV